MKVRNQKPNGEIITSGQHFVSGKDAVAIAVSRRLRTYLKECFLNIDVGVPYYETVFAPSADSAKEAAIKFEIMETPGVSAILAFAFDINEQREITCEAILLTTENEEVEVRVPIISNAGVFTMEGGSYGADY